MIEGALTLIVFVSLFLGAFDIGQVMYTHQSIVERVRLAARTASVNCCSVDNVKNMILYGSTTVPTGSPSTFWGLTSSNIAVTFSDQNTANQRVTIRVTGAVYRTFTPMLMGTFTSIPVQVTIPLELP